MGYNQTRIRTRKLPENRTCKKRFCTLRVAEADRTQGSSRMNNRAGSFDDSLIAPSLRRVRDSLPGIVNATTTPEESSKAWGKHLEQVRLQDRIKRLEAGPQSTRRRAPGTPKKPAKVSLKGQDDDGRDDRRDDRRRDPNDRAETLLRSLKAECENLRTTNKEIELTLKERSSLKRKRAELEEAMKGDEQGEEGEDWELRRRDPRRRTHGSKILTPQGS